MAFFDRTAEVGLTLDCDILTKNQVQGVEGADAFGGGLYNAGTAKVIGCTFTFNQVTGAGSFTALGGSCGGAIENYAGGDLTVERSLFSKNEVVSADGDFYFSIAGAIDTNSGVNGFDPNGAVPSTLTVRNSQFYDNVSQSGARGISNCGAISVSGIGSSMKLSDSVFARNLSLGGAGATTANTGEGVAGAIGSVFSTVDIARCQFTGNQAVGGANADTSGDARTAGAFGGAIENNFGSTMHITDSYFAGNLAKGGDVTSGNAGGAWGGAISNSPNGTLVITRTVIANNQAVAGQGGGAIAFGGGIDTTDGSNTTITGSFIINNLAKGSDGNAGNKGGDALGGGLDVGSRAVFGVDDASTLTLTNTLVAGNRAIGGAGGAGANGGNGLGGGIYLASLADTPHASVTLNRSLVIFNTAKGGAAGAGGTAGRGSGGGIYNDGGDLSIDAFSAVFANHASTDHDNIFP